MANNSSTVTKDIKYLNKDFSDFRAALIEYAKAYFPTTYNDFSTASPGSMFLEMAAYVGDVLSFYLDNQYQETFVQYAKQANNLYTLAYMLGYRPKVTSAATVDLDVYQLVPASGSTGNYVPDFRYALQVDQGMQVTSNTNTSAAFYIPENIDFSISSSTSPTSISVYNVDGSGNPQYFLLQKSAKALSGTIKTFTYTFGTAQTFETILLQDTNIIEILSVNDSNGNKWYEVPYLAQDTIMKAVQNVPNINPDYAADAGTVPYILELMTVPRRFVTRFKTDNTLEIQFGSGINSVANEVVVPNMGNVGIGTLDRLSKINTIYDPANFTTTSTYGLAPSNTTLTFTYLVGGGAQANVPSNTLNTVVNFTSNFNGGIVDTTIGSTVRGSLAVNNPAPAAGGGDGDTVEQLRLNILAQYPSQMRAVTQQDYLSFAYSMPPKFGQVAKAFVTKDNLTFRQDTGGDSSMQDPYACSLYILSYDSNKHLQEPPAALQQNLKSYLSEYRMLTDAVNIKNAYIVNIGVDFSIILRPQYNSRDVLTQCIQSLQSYFAIDGWQINQPIILSELYTLIDQIPGVQTVQNVTITNKSATDGTYSLYTYDISSATLKGVIYPSLDPSIFEVKYPDIDITGKVVTY